MQEEKLREAIVGELKRQAADSRSPSASAVRRSRRQWQDRYRRARHGDRRVGGGRLIGPPTDRQRQLIIVVAPLVGVDKILQENGTSRTCRSQRRRSSWATSAETSSDQPSAVLNTQSPGPDFRTAPQAGQASPPPDLLSQPPFDFASLGFRFGCFGGLQHVEAAAVQEERVIPRKYRSVALAPDDHLEAPQPQIGSGPALSGLNSAS
jgi:hypothetical protein